jgi:uncharacterized protein YbbK (DUF523 family)
MNRGDAGPMILSACLAGVECKYNATSAGAMEKSVNSEVLLVCPESLAASRRRAPARRLSVVTASTFSTDERG